MDRSHGLTYDLCLNIQVTVIKIDDVLTHTHTLTRSLMVLQSEKALHEDVFNLFVPAFVTSAETCWRLLCYDPTHFGREMRLIAMESICSCLSPGENKHTHTHTTTRKHSTSRQSHYYTDTNEIPKTYSCCRNVCPQGRRQRAIQQVNEASAWCLWCVEMCFVCIYIIIHLCPHTTTRRIPTQKPRSIIASARTAVEQTRILKGT